MRNVTRIVLIAVLSATAIPALAQELTSCWTGTELDRYGFEQTVTRCRISGGETVDYDSASDVPVVLWPTTDGTCWYLTTVRNDWILLLTLGNMGLLFWDPPPEGGPTYQITPESIPPCTSEPGEAAVDPAVEAWEYVSSFVHPPPTPVVNPTPGDGVTGLETFVGVEVPEAHDTQLASATGSTLDIHIEVAAVIVDWGDAQVDTFEADAEALSGYPNGDARHIYEIKDEAGYDLGISYDWTARWRVDGGDWEDLDVPPTTTSILYPVAEIVSVISE